MVSKVIVFIIGESGIGKELCVCVVYLVLFWVNKFFVVLNCVVIFKDLIESEIFGYLKGVFIGVIVNWEGVVG